MIRMSKKPTQVVFSLLRAEFDESLNTARKRRVEIVFIVRGENNHAAKKGSAIS